MTVDEDTGHCWRPDRPRDDVLGELAALRRTLCDTDSVAREAAEVLSELAPQVEDVNQRLAELRGVVAQLAADPVAAATAEDATLTARKAELGLADEPPAPWCWPLLDRQQAAAAWDALARWIGEILVPQYGITRRQLPDCWARHPRMVAELSWLRHAYLEAHQTGAPAVRAQDWHLRGLSGALDAVDAAVPRDSEAIGDKRRALCGPGHHQVPPPADRHEMQCLGELPASANHWGPTWRAARNTDVARRRPASD